MIKKIRFAPIVLISIALAEMVQLLSGCEQLSVSMQVPQYQMRINGHLLSEIDTNDSLVIYASDHLAHYARQDTDMAIIYFDSLLYESKSKVLMRASMCVYKSKIRLLRDRNEYIPCYFTIKDAISFFTKHGNTENLGRVYLEASFLFSNTLNEPDLGGVYSKMATEIFAKIPEQDDRYALALSMMIRYYLEKKQFDSATVYARKRIEVTKAMKRRIAVEYIASAWVGMAEVFFESKQYDSAWFAIRAADHYASMIQDKYFGNLHLIRGQLWLMDGRADSSVMDFKIAYVNGKKTDNKILIEQAGQWLSKWYAQNRQMDSAFIYLNESDSLARKRMEVSRYQSVLKEMVKDEEMLKNKAIINNRQNKITSIVVSIFLIIILGFAIFLILKRRELKRINMELIDKNKEIENQKRAIVEQKEEIKTQNNFLEKQNIEIAEQKRFISHRTINDLKAAVGIVNGKLRVMDQEHPNQTFAKIQMQDIKSRMEALASATFALIDRGDNMLDMPQEIEKQILAIARSRLDHFDKDAMFDRIFSCQIETLLMSAIQGTCVLKIVNEALTNAFKYAHQGTLPHIRVVLQTLSDGNLKLEISDNGPGFGDKSFEEMSKKRDKGMGLIKANVDKLHGNIEVFSSSTGTTLKIIWNHDKILY